MGLLVNDRKLKAAAFSMHQFCQEVRCIFPGDVDDRVIEAATVYLYVSLARDLFGHRFAIRLQKRLRGNLKYSTPAEVEGHVARIARQSESLERAAASQATERTPAVIEAMLADAGFQDPADEDARKAYIKFEAAIMVIRKHLVGIKEQNYFLMKSKPLT
ncbi:MAG: hypothetical protein ACYTBR_16305 [Planctomycetota bacterium]|jgi:hypothetical protein